MILDFLTIFFLVVGFLLLIRLIRQRRRTLAKIVVEERVHELEPAAVGASSFGRRDIYSEDHDAIIKGGSVLISQDGLRERASSAWPDKGTAPKHLSQSDFDLSKLIAVLEAFAPNDVQNGIGDHFATDASTGKARPKMTSSDPAEEHSLSAPTTGPTLETETPGAVLEHRNTIISADDDLAKMLRKIGPDS
jgi:hypothetical protein